ncbi:MAG TPA: hypothetical protein VFO05_02530 [Candidatus Limnocylindrales bacterium]|nr:hypothetical protein [Candidatus Limnocylindrales bacterium]
MATALGRGDVRALAFVACPPLGATVDVHAARRIATIASIDITRAAMVIAVPLAPLIV